MARSNIRIALCLRTNVQDWDQEALWRTYTSLTDVESVFRSLKSELGLRPIFHRTQGRSEPRRVWRRPFCLSHAAMSDCSSMA